MVNEDIGLDKLTAALDRVLDAAVRGRILVSPTGTPESPHDQEPA